MSAMEQPTRRYRGNCHCGAFVFEVEAPEIETVGDCKCSICTKRGYKWLVPKKPPTIVKDEGKLFCGTCRTTVMATNDTSPRAGLNVQIIQGLDITSLDVRTINGVAYDPQYVAPTFSGAEPSPPGFEDGKVYHGSCHCGAVTLAVKVNGSLEDGTYKEPMPIMTCNCSFCRQGDYVWMYPSSKQLAIQGSENMFYYTFGYHVWRKSFCKTCGVHIGSDPNPHLTDEDIAALPEAVREFRAAHIDTRSLNMGVLNGFDVKSVEPVRPEGWERQPAYVYP